MPRVCTICTPPARPAIHEGLVAGQALWTVSGPDGPSKSSVDSHQVSHLPPSPTRSAPISRVSLGLCGDACEPTPSAG
jgi:hypothetical protein